MTERTKCANSSCTYCADRSNEYKGHGRFDANGRCCLHDVKACVHCLGHDLSEALKQIEELTGKLTHVEAQLEDARHYDVRGCMMCDTTYCPEHGRG